MLYSGREGEDVKVVKVKVVHTEQSGSFIEKEREKESFFSLLSLKCNQSDDQADQSASEKSAMSRWAAV